MKYLIKWILSHIPRKYIQLFARALTRLVSVFYIGNRVECTICGKHYRKFLPYGYNKSRLNALCPYCLSLERHRLMELYLRERTDFYSSQPHVLHVAPEQCFIKNFEKILGDKYITADLESPLAKVKMDVLAIPFPDNTFDVVFCNHLLEHIENDHIAIRELYRVMKPGAWGIIQSPVSNIDKTYENPAITDPKERKKHFGQYDHMRIYGLDYPERLAGCGFDVTKDNFSQTLPDEMIKRHSLAKHETIYLVKKL